MPTNKFVGQKIDYSFAAISETDLTGQVRRSRTTPGAIQLPLADVKSLPLTEADFESLLR